MIGSPDEVGAPRVARDGDEIRGAEFTADATPPDFASLHPGYN